MTRLGGPDNDGGVAGGPITDETEEVGDSVVKPVSTDNGN